MRAPGPVLETERLILRPTAAEDIDGFAELMADEETARFIGGVMSRPAVWRGVCGMAGAWTLHGFGMFSVLRKSDGAWIGRIGPWAPEGWPGTEVGWGLLAAHQGKGYALEAAEASIDWAFDALGWTEVIHTIDPDNAASIALAERLGSVRRGPVRLPAPFESARVDAWAQSREAWTARRAGAPRARIVE